VITVAVAAWVSALVAGACEHQTDRWCAAARWKIICKNVVLWGSLLVFVYGVVSLAWGRH
jgi:hypothetical protein